MLDEVRNLEAVVVSVEQGVCGLRNEVGTLRKEGDATIGVTEQLQREMHAMREEMAALRSEVAHLRSVNEAQEEQLHQHEERLQRSQLTSSHLLASPATCIQRKETVIRINNSTPTSSVSSFQSNQATLPTPTIAHSNIPAQATLTEVDEGKRFQV